MLSKSHTKYIQSLHLKKYRDHENAFIAEGSKVVIDLIKSPKIVCEHLLGKAAWMAENEAEIRRFYKGPLEVVEDYELEKISALSSPNQVLGVFSKMKPAIITVKENITLVLDNIQDPGNLGTIIRIADWFGITAIICSETCADIYNPKVVQSTMGSLGRVEVLYTSLVEWLKKNEKIPVYAAALNGQPMDSLKGLSEGILVIGNESRGISAEIMQVARQRITIPKYGEAESLNAAVATGIILSHLR